MSIEIKINIKFMQMNEIHGKLLLKEEIFDCLKHVAFNHEYYLQNTIISDPLRPIYACF